MLLDNNITHEFCKSIRLKREQSLLQFYSVFASRIISATSKDAKFTLSFSHETTFTARADNTIF